MFADDDRLDKEKWDAAKNAVGNPLSWPKKATDQALITDYFGQGLAFLEVGLGAPGLSSRSFFK